MKYNSKLSQRDYNPSEVMSSYSLILMDCNMPFMDGFECTKLIRNFFWKEFGASVYEQPIIAATTGHAEEKYTKKCFDCGMNQVMSKPIQIDSLLSACIKGGLTTKLQVDTFHESKSR